ncbi:MAG: ribonuclease III [Ruminococcaceae bacterium]|nr:ribonuclease III [Oscillospiraceae bacterium]
MEKNYPNISDLEKKLNYCFKDTELLKGALIHTSYANEHTRGKNVVRSNERIEFLGDSVLGLAAGSYIYETYSDMPEGRMSKLRASVVCEGTLADIAFSIGLDKYVRLGVGEAQTGGRNKPSILSDALESVFAAVYLDAGYDVARNVVLSFIVPEIEKRVDNFVLSDYKSSLQEYCAKKHMQVSYEIVGETGPEHSRNFSAKAATSDGMSAIGEGRSKKDAEQLAARRLLKVLQDK